MSVRSRVAFAAGAAGLVGATLLLSGRAEGSVALALLLATAARAAAPATLVDGGAILASGAVRSLGKHVSFAPAWALVLVVGTLRAGSGGIGDARGANAVAGIALARGPALSIIGAWLAAAAGAIALASRTSIGVETAAGAGATGRVTPPGAVRRLEAAGVLAQAAVLVTLFAGPQVTGALDAVWWAAGISGLAAFAWRARELDLANASGIAAALAGAGVVLGLLGGAP